MLDPGEVWTYTATYALQQADIDAGGIVNQADALASAPDGTDLRDRSDDGLPGGTDDPTRVPLTATPGSRARRRCRRAGDGGVHRGLHGGGDEYRQHHADGDRDCQRHADPRRWHAAGADLGPVFLGASLGSAEGTLLPGEVARYDLRYTLTQADVDAGGIRNTATVTGTAPGGAVLTDVTDNGNDADGNTTDDPTVLAVPGAPALTLGKRLAAGSGPAFDAVGDVLAFEFRVTNSGNVTLPGPFTVADPLITGAGGSIACPAGPLAPAAVLTCTGSYTVTQADLDAGEIINAATVSTVLGGSPVTSPADSVTVPALQSPALAVVKTAEAVSAAQFVVGAVVDYTYVVTNTGNTTLTAPVTISDNRIAAVSCPALPLGGLAPAATLTCTGSYTVTADDVELGVVTNLASATSGGVTSPLVSETVPDEGVPALAMTKTATTASFAAAGDVLAYSFTVTNTGTRAFVQPVVVDDSLIGPVSCFAPSGADQDFRPGETVSCSASYTVTQADVDAGRVVNEANAATTYGGGTPVVSNPVTETVTVDAAPALTLEKQATPAAVTAVGQTVTFRLTITNTGNQTLRAVEATDPMLPGWCAGPPRWRLGRHAVRGALCGDAGRHRPRQPDQHRHRHRGDPGRRQRDGDRQRQRGHPRGGTGDGAGQDRHALALRCGGQHGDLPADGDEQRHRDAERPGGQRPDGARACLHRRAAGTRRNLGPCAFAVTVTQADVDRGSLTNTASASGRAPDGTLLGDDATLVTPGPAARPGLEVTKTVAPAAPWRGSRWSTR